MPLYPHSILKKPKETKPDMKQPESKQPEVKQPENEADVFDRPTAQPGKTNCIFMDESFISVYTCSSFQFDVSTVEIENTKRVFTFLATK